jgi:hypothetical protein
VTRQADLYRVRLEESLAKAASAGGEEEREVWTNIARQYQKLIEDEGGIPTETAMLNYWSSDDRA